MAKVYRVICKEDRPYTNQVVDPVKIVRIECTVTIDEEAQTIYDAIRIVEEHFKAPLMIMSITDVAEELKHLNCRNR